MLPFQRARAEVIKTELEVVRESSRKVDRASRSLYLKLLKRGASGAGIDQLALDMDLEAVATPTLKGAMGKLMKEGFVTELSQGRYVATSSLKATGKTYEITVEKIYPGPLW